MLSLGHHDTGFVCSALCQEAYMVHGRTECFGDIYKEYPKKMRKGAKVLWKLTMQID